MGSVAGDTASLSYPPAHRDESIVDTYHGVQIPDPYRWMEDPDSEETKEFVARQAKLAESVLAGCSERESLHREVTRLFDHPRHAAPFRYRDKYFYFHNSGLQAQSVLYVQTGKSKHYGFMEFENPEVAKIVADEMNNYLLFEHTLQIALVPPDKVLFVELKYLVLFVFAFLRRMSRPLQRPRLKHVLRGNFRIGHSALRGGRFPYACPPPPCWPPPRIVKWLTNPLVSYDFVVMDALNWNKQFCNVF